MATTEASLKRGPRHPAPVAPSDPATECSYYEHSPVALPRASRVDVRNTNIVARGVAPGRRPAARSRVRWRAVRAPLLLFALPAALVALWPGARELLVLDRTALAGGQLWRLWTGHWVHFSGSHLLWNLAVLVVAGAWLERVRPGRLWRHGLFAAPCIGLAVLACEPGLHLYGGLSGLATGVVVLLALHQLRTPDAPRLLWAVVFALVAAKSVYDLASPDALFTRYDLPGVRTASTAHAAGALAAGLHAALSRWRVDRLSTPAARRQRSPDPAG